MIRHIVLHEIIKTKGFRNATFRPSVCEVAINQTAETFVTEIHEAISKSTKKVHGIFTSAGTSYFKQELDRFISNPNQYDIQEEAKAFIGSSHDSSLISLLNAETLSTGGHVMLINYENLAREYLITVMLNNKKGRALNINSDGIPELVNTEQLDLSLLDLACRIDLTSYQENPSEKNYICFIPGRDNISAYFVKFIGCEQFNQNKHNTKKLVEIIKSITKEMPNREELNSAAYEYCENRRKNKDPIDIFSLSEHIFGLSSRDKLYQYAADNNISIDNSFSITTTEVKRLINFVYHGDWIANIKFDRDNIGSNITYNSEDNTVTLKNVSGLVRELKYESS